VALDRGSGWFKINQVNHISSNGEKIELLSNFMDLAGVMFFWGNKMLINYLKTY